MKILVIKGKNDRQYYDVSTPEREAVALRRMFESNDEDGCYEIPEVQKKVLREDSAKLKTFLNERQDYEYEGWEIVEPINPLA